jgi:EAL domain-containing protein (putative c-di-GMP-specific phosphodiesterase class I)
MHRDVTLVVHLPKLIRARPLEALQGLGVHVGIDDLGTGHSGLSYMLKLGVDIIKIDKIFVDALDTERYSATIIETLVGLARDMRMEIIAEGVETYEQLAFLREEGCNEMQGYLIGAPMSAEELAMELSAQAKNLPSRTHALGMQVAGKS